MTVQKVQLNGYSLWVSLFYVSYVVFKIWFPNYEGMYSLMGSLMLLVGGVAGIQACASFGGGRSFTGRIALYFAVALFLVSISMLASSMSELLSYAVKGVLSSVNLASFVLAQCISTYALIASVRAVMARVNTRTIFYILLALLFSVGIGWFNFGIGTQVGLIQTNLDQVFWVGLFPTLIFLQLASALVLFDLLGKWYATRTIRVIALGFVCFDLLFPPAMVFVLVAFLGFLGNQVTALLTGISLQAVTAMFIVSLALTQMRPRQSGPFYVTH